MTWKHRIGRLPAPWVLLALFLLAGLVAVVGDASPAAWLAVPVVAALVLYCWARPAGGLEVFWIAATPNAVAALLHDVAGTPRWLVVALLPIAIWLAVLADRESRVQRRPVTPATDEA